MPITRMRLPESSVDFTVKCKEWLWRAAQQKALAKEMIERSQKMRDRAVEMRKRKLPSPHWRALGY